MISFQMLFEQYKDEEIISTYPQVNAQERQTLWTKGYTLGLTKIRGVVYHNPGIGRMTSGHSLINSKTSAEIVRWIYKLKEQVSNSYELICKHLNIRVETAKFKVRFGETTLELYEKETNEVLLEFPGVFLE